MPASVSSRLVLALIGLKFFLGSCGDGDEHAADKVCLPGDSRLCACPDGEYGDQTCDSDGLGWGTCECEPPGGCEDQDCGACQECQADDTCGFAEAGTDPGDDCEPDQALCGTTGDCDGQGACALAGSDVVCDDGDLCTLDDHCSGAGECAGDPVTCSGHGSCDDSGGEPVCDCDPGYKPGTSQLECIGAEPAINVRQGEVDIPSGTGSYDFGDVGVDGEGGLASDFVVFTIENEGGGELAIEEIALTSGAIDDFDLLDTSTSPVAPGGNTNFSISLDPLELLSKTAEVRIVSNDPDVPEYTFTVRGRGWDTIAPVPGNSGIIEIVEVQSMAVKLRWTVGLDDLSEQRWLSYQVVYSENDNISTVEHAETYGTVALAWATDVDSFMVQGLTPDTQYYFNVLIRDQTQNKSAYRSVSTTTELPPVYMFGTTAVYSPNLGGRAGADSKCQDEYDANFTGLNCDHVHAFISVSDTDEIRDMMNSYGLPGSRRFRSPTQVLIDNNFTLLLDGSIQNDLSTVLPGGLPHSVWWSGSTDRGELDTDNHCNGWTNATASYYARLGRRDETGSAWLAGLRYNCGASVRPLVCLCWQD